MGGKKKYINIFGSFTEPFKCLTSDRDHIPDPRSEPYSGFLCSVTITYTFIITLHASCGAVYCSRFCLCVCGFVCVYLWVCYHNKSKLRALILTKLDL